MRIEPDVPSRPLPPGSFDPASFDLPKLGPPSPIATYGFWASLAIVVACAMTVCVVGGLAGVGTVDRTENEVLPSLAVAVGLLPLWPARLALLAIGRRTGTAPTSIRTWILRSWTPYLYVSSAAGFVLAECFTGIYQAFATFTF